MSENKTLNIKLYKYDYDVCKVGKNVSSTNTKTLATYYNWCLDKATKYNVIKWDADFVANEDNLKEMINTHKLTTRDDNFALWFTGITMFEHKNIFYEKNRSYYEEFRVFSKRHGFKWVDCGKICEAPNIQHVKKRCRYNKCIFYEIKRTSINEFENRFVMIDRRDTEDNVILQNLMKNDMSNNVTHNKIFCKKYLTYISF